MDYSCNRTKKEKKINWQKSFVHNPSGVMFYYVFYGLALRYPPNAAAVIANVKIATNQSMMCGL